VHGGHRTGKVVTRITRLPFRKRISVPLELAFENAQFYDIVQSIIQAAARAPSSAVFDRTNACV
jgi:hypothetical protein